MAELSELERRATAAFDAWSAPVCTHFRSDYRGLASAPALRDGRNTIAVVSSGWTDRGFPAGRAATTEVRAEVDASGRARIVEADIYLNFEEFTFRLSTPTGLDATAVLLHEVGHLAGLLHPCGDAGAPVCSSDPLFAESVLLPDTTPTSPQRLSSDDVAGICTIYPARPATCDPGCGPSEMCLAGVCSPCASADCGGACDGGLCSSRVCTGPTDCPGATCALVGDHAGECVPAGGLGAPCTAGDECASGRCLTYTSGSFCTTSCALGESCGGGLTCGVVEGMQLCIRESSAASCAASHQTPGGLPLGAMLLGLATAIVGRRRAARRASGEQS